MSVVVEIVAAHRAEQVAIARQLFREYADAIGVDLEYQGFTRELAALPSPYAPPHGALLVAQVGTDVAGCVALRRLDDNAGEMKRLYVRPAFRGLGIAERLIAGVSRRRAWRGLPRAQARHAGGHALGPVALSQAGVRRDSAVQRSAFARHPVLYAVVGPGCRVFCDASQQGRNAELSRAMRRSSRTCHKFKASPISLLVRT